MAYKPGVALGASITLALFGAGLLGLYITCSHFNCRFLPLTYFSPLWTGGMALLTAIVGAFMSLTKSEEGCGPFFLTVSIISIFTALACMGFTAYAVAHAVEQLLYDDVLSLCLWIAMMTVAFVLSLITCVTSCQYCCCCQETQRNQETVVVYQGKQQRPQNIIVSNTNTIQQPQQQVNPQIVLLDPNEAHHGGQFGGAPGQPGYPPAPNATQPSGAHPNQLSGQPRQRSSLPPSYQPETPVANQIRPVKAGQNQSRPSSFYQPLLQQNNQTSSSPVQQTYFTPEQAQQGSSSPPHQLPGAHLNPTYTYNLNDLGDGSHVGPDQSTNPAFLNDRVYQYIPEPSHDYLDAQMARENVSPAEHARNNNDTTANRPKKKKKPPKKHGRMK